MSKLQIVITDLVDDATCEFTGKTGEAVQVHFEPDRPASLIGLNSLISMIRFTAAQQQKTAFGEGPKAPNEPRKPSRATRGEATDE